MRGSSHRALRLGGAFLALLLPLSVVGCGGGSSSTPTQTVRGIVLLDTETGATDGDPLAGLLPVVSTDVRIVAYGDSEGQNSFDSIPRPKTDAKGQFVIKPYRGGQFFYLNIANRCSTTPEMSVSREGTIFATPTTIENFNNASDALQQRAREIFAAMQASNDANKPDVLILVSDQNDACRS